MSVFKGISLEGKIGKSLGYVMWAINSGLSLTHKIGRKAYDKVSKRPRYDVIIHVDGVEITAKRAIYTNEVSRLVDALELIEGVQINIKVTEDEIFKT